MGEDFYELAYINFDKVILHGRRIGGTMIDQELTPEQRERVGQLVQKHRIELDRLLKDLAA